MKQLFKNLLTILMFIGIVCSANASSIKIDAAHFPDAGFRGEVSDYDQKFGNKNGYLDDAEIAKVVMASYFTTATSIRVMKYGTSIVSGASTEINDITGIKYFTSLTKFGPGSGGNLTINPSSDYTIDLSGMTKLEEVYITNPLNEFSLHVNLKNCTALKVLSIYRENAPVTFDITGCKNIETISKEQCQGVSNSTNFSLSTTATDFPKLTKVKLYNNYNLTNININCPTLKELYIKSCNSLTGSGVSIGANTNLEILDISDNANMSYATFNVEKFTKLTKLNLSGNKFSSMTFDVSKLNVLLADGESYFGNQGNKAEVTVKMTTTQKANFKSTDDKNKYVKIIEIEDKVSFKKDKPADCLCFTAKESNISVSFVKKGTLTQTPSIIYSFDGVNWYDYSFDSGITLADIGKKVYFMAKDQNATFSEASDKYINFTSTGNVEASGSVMSLIDSKCQKTTVPNYCFCSLFVRCKGLTVAPKLPATTVGEHSYRTMFAGSGITTAPELPATNLDIFCYWYMFNRCTNLKYAPTILPAKTAPGRCYEYMFWQCTSLETTPVISATTLGIYCFSYMFNGCTSLKKMPKLPATKLENGCYSNMFSKCTNLTDVVELPATELAAGCYEYMFSGCTSLKKMPKLPVTKLESGCYNGMFYGCTNLTEVEDLPATELAAECYESMFSECNNLKIAPSMTINKVAEKCCRLMFYNCLELNTISIKLNAMTLEKQCYLRMFEGCMKLIKAPELPATTLAENCYMCMFWACTSLTQAPYLPATNLTEKCYESMFYGCKKLEKVEVNFTDWNTEGSSTTHWLGYVPDSGSFICPKALDTSSRGSDTVPAGWSVSHPVFKATIVDLTALIAKIIKGEEMYEPAKLQDIIDNILGK